MVKIWAKVLKEHKIVKTTTLYKNVDKMDWSLFFDYVSEICHSLDIPTPIILKNHIFNYAKFNFVKFNKDDFVESIDFDCLWLENADR